MKRLRLLWLIDSLNVGGAETLAVTFAQHVNRDEVDLFVCAIATVNGNPLEAELRAAGIPTVNLGARNLRDLAAFRRLLRFVRENRIELVHAHLTYASIWASLLSRLTGVPAIASLHVRVASTREQEKTEGHRKRVDLRDRLMRFAVRRWAARLVMVSAALRDDYLAGGGLDPAKIRVVHNGIEVDRFDRDRAETRARLTRELDLPADAPLLVTVSVLRPGKGVEVLLAAMEKIPNAYVVIIGDGSMREEWQRLARERGIADRVRWAGFRRDVDALLAGCDLMVHPSLDDAFPTVLLEASAASLPIVASNLGGIPEIVVQNETGALVPKGDPDALAAAVNALLADRPAMERMRVAARKRARELFSTEAWISRLKDVYGEAVAARAASSRLAGAPR